MHIAVYILSTCVSLAFTGPSALMMNIMKIDENVSAIVQWDAADVSLPTTYTVNWTSITTPMQSAIVTDQSSYTITGLTLDTVYTVIVLATDRCGTSPESTASVTIPTGMWYFIIFKPGSATHQPVASLNLILRD